MNDQNNPLISVVIPIKNGAPWLRKTIPALLNQTLAKSTEIIAIDSGSSDETLSILSEYAIKVIQIPAESFNHGNTRNLGVQKARGKYVVMTVQDAEAANEKWLQNLLDGFGNDNVAGVCGLQIVAHDLDKNPMDWFRPVDTPGIKKYHFENAAAFDALSNDEKKAICSWDDVNAMYRRDILLEVPFQPVDFSEDAIWARDVLRKGYSIVYNGLAQVYHYHAESPDYTYRRSFAVYYHNYLYFGVKPVYYGREFIRVLKNIKLLLKESRIGWNAKWKWLQYNRQQRKAINKAISAFYKALANGETALKQAHSIICERPPQAEQLTHKI